MPSTSAIVGSRSMVRTGREMILPRRWPGSFTKSGTRRIQPAFAGLSRRRDWPGMKAAP